MEELLTATEAPHTVMKIQTVKINPGVPACVHGSDLGSKTGIQCDRGNRKV